MTEMGRGTLEKKGQEVGNEIWPFLSGMCLLINLMAVAVAEQGLRRCEGWGCGELWGVMCLGQTGVWQKLGS